MDLYPSSRDRPPAPDHRAYGVHNDVSPVLAQTFTEPFVVFSAKRFPGVPGKSCGRPLPIRPDQSLSMLNELNACPDTTALSIALGNQGQKLPLVSLSAVCFARSDVFARAPVHELNCHLCATRPPTHSATETISKAESDHGTAPTNLETSLINLTRPRVVHGSGFYA